MNTYLLYTLAATNIFCLCLQWYEHRRINKLIECAKVKWEWYE